MAGQAIQGLSPEEAAAWLKNAAELGWLPTTSPTQASNTSLPTASSSKSNRDLEIEAAPGETMVDNSIYPNQPLLLLNNNIGRLAPHAEHWYTFRQDDLDENLFEEMSLTMFQTPGEGNIANLVNFSLFTGDQYHIWERGTPNEMTNFGAGQLVSRDKDPDTGERLWRGLIIDGDRYYLKIKNDSEVWVDYYLMIGDIINTELGGAPNIRRIGQSLLPVDRIKEVVLPTEVLLGDTIASPLPVEVGRNQGRLQGGEDVWFTFRFQNFEQEEMELRRYTMYLKHSPGLGHVANHVNLELYTFPQLELWLRGDGDLITPMGVGSREEYDPETNTQEFTWEGKLVSDTTYFLRIRNDSAMDIFYDLDIQER
jgi:hypothetical protein